MPDLLEDKVTGIGAFGRAVWTGETSSTSGYLSVLLVSRRLLLPLGTRLELGPTDPLESCSTPDTGDFTEPTRDEDPVGSD